MHRAVAADLPASIMRRARYHSSLCCPPVPHAGGVTMNDFIVASKVNALRVVDLLPAKKKKFWA